MKCLGRRLGIHWQVSVSITLYQLSLKHEYTYETTAHEVYNETRRMSQWGSLVHTLSEVAENEELKEDTNA